MTKTYSKVGELYARSFIWE